METQASCQIEPSHHRSASARQELVLSSRTDSVVVLGVLGWRSGGYRHGEEEGWEHEENSGSWGLALGKILSVSSLCSPRETRASRATMAGR